MIKFRQIIGVISSGFFLAMPLAAVCQTPVVNPKKLFVCPSIKNITQNDSTGTWSTKSGFKSFSRSLATKLSAFYGAQWHGATVGQIFCVYKAEPAGTFPVVLALQAISKEPSGHKWGKNLGSIRNCKTREQKDCPFTVMMHHKQKDIYKQLEQLKP